MLYRVERKRIVTEVFLICADDKETAVEAHMAMEEYMADEADDVCGDPDIKEITEEEIEDQFNNVWEYKNEKLVPKTTFARTRQRFQKLKQGR